MPSCRSWGSRRRATWDPDRAMNPSELPVSPRGRLLLADDHPVMRAGLRRLLERSGVDVVAEAGDGDEAVRLTLTERPDIALIDLDMPKLGGVEAARQIALACPRTRVVMLSGHSTPQHVTSAARAGVAAFIVKGATFEQMLAILDAVREGRAYTGSPEAGMTIDHERRQSGSRLRATGLDKLTPREREVLTLVADGYSSASIAAILRLSVRTVETHRLHVMHKLDVHSLAELMRLAIKHGLA
jgi:DNA-binding NarL/FixJ family response regulator